MQSSFAVFHVPLYCGTTGSFFPVIFPYCAQISHVCGLLKPAQWLGVYTISVSCVACLIGSSSPALYHGFVNRLLSTEAQYNLGKCCKQNMLGMESRHVGSSCRLRETLRIII